MAVRKIVTLDQPLLREQSEPVSFIDAHIRRLVEDMFDTMYDAPGIGLAAVQIGITKRVITVDLSKDKDAPERHVLINAEITWRSTETEVHEEGCLSIPEYYEEVKRPARVRARYLDLHGNQREIEADGLLATCLQHEIDHTNGILFIDYISRLKRSLIIKKFAKVAKVTKKVGA